MKKLVLVVLVSLALLSGAVAGEKVVCGLGAAVLMTQVDETHVKFHVALSVKCPDQETKVYESREATLDTTSTPEVGAILLQAMAQEISGALKADGAEVPANDILAHAELKSLEP